MNTWIRSMAVALLLSMLAASPADAQPFLRPSKKASDLIIAPPAQGDASPVLKTSPKDKDKMTAPSATSTLKRPLKNKRVLSGGLGIHSLKASRVGNVILIHGVVHNTSSSPLQFDFTIYTSVGNPLNANVVLEGKARHLGPKEASNLTVQIPNTNRAMTITLDINGGYNNEISVKEFFLKERRTNFVVRYGTHGEWVVAREYPRDLSNGFDASEFARTGLNPYGLDTKIRKTTSSGLDTPLSVTTHIYTTLYVRTAGQITKEFGTRKEAEKFRKLLISRVSDRRLTVESVREQEF